MNNNFEKQYASDINNAYLTVLATARLINASFNDTGIYLNPDDSINSDAINTVIACAGVKRNYHLYVYNKIIKNFFTD